jgi:hypothetical protein
MIYCNLEKTSRQLREIHRAVESGWGEEVPASRDGWRGNPFSRFHPDDSGGTSFPAHADVV